MQVTVYHHLIASVEMEKPIIYPVAHFLDVPNHDGVFRATNSIDESWIRARDEGIMVYVRSTSVGDLYKVTTDRGARPIWFKVASAGFEGLTDAEVKENYILTEPVTAESAERANHDPRVRKQLFG